MIKKEELKLTQEWDKTFKKSDKVDHSKVTFANRYGITLAADMYVPKDAEGKLPAIAVSGPFGAVKEQCSGLYAQTMAERGFLTIAFDPSFTASASYVIRSMVGGIDSFPLLAVPMFVLAGILMARGQISKRLFDVFSYFLGKRTAGIPCVFALAGRNPALAKLFDQNG